MIEGVVGIAVVAAVVAAWATVDLVAARRRRRRRLLERVREARQPVHCRVLPEQRQPAP
ncbi:MAG: hypothetical protein LC640_09440 [Frankia sp.]|nr:hypothetical protein [Frankia sp.]